MLLTKGNDSKLCCGGFVECTQLNVSLFNFSMSIGFTEPKEMEYVLRAGVGDLLELLWSVLLVLRVW